MKVFKYMKPKSILPIVAVLVLTACDLELQEGYDFTPEVDLTDPFAEITAWQWIQTRTALNDEGEISNEEFNYMIEAIKRADMVDEYSGSTTDRTFLLLNNNAFTGGGNIIELITGSEEIGEGETPEQVMARADVDVLKLILQYHIVTTYIDQIPTLFEYDQWYLFQTLIPGEDGVIGFLRDPRYRVRINGTRGDRVPSPLPPISSREFEEVRGHNYVFANGIGHIIADPVRNQPYPEPNP